MQGRWEWRVWRIEGGLRLGGRLMMWRVRIEGRGLYLGRKKALRLVLPETLSLSILYAVQLNVLPVLSLALALLVVLRARLLTPSLSLELTLRTLRPLRPLHLLRPLRPVVSTLEPLLLRSLSVAWLCV